jgi:hypothetical protein
MSEGSGYGASNGVEDQEVRWSPVLLYGAIVVINGLIGLGSIYLPLGADQGNYAYAAWAWSEGEVPYRDVLVFKPPVTLFFYRIAHILFGHSASGIRWIDLAWQVSTAVLLAAFTYHWTKNRLAAASTAVIYALCYYQFNFWHSAQSEGWATLPMVVGLLAATKAVESADWRPMLVSGMAIAFAAGLKYTLILGAIPVTVLLVLRAPRERWWPLGLAFGVGGLTVAVAGLFWLMGIGAWQAYVDHHLNTLPAYAGYSLHGRTVDGLLVMVILLVLSPQLSVLALSLILGILGYLAGRILGGWREDMRCGLSGTRTFRLVGLSFLLAMAVATFSQGKFFEYHYLPWLGPAAMLAGLGFADALAAFSRRIGFGMLGLFVIAVGVTSKVATLSADWVKLASGQSSLEEHWSDERFVRPNHSVRDSHAAVRWLQANTDEGDRIFIWGRDPGIAYLSARHIPTKFIYNYYFRFPWADSDLENQLVSELDRGDPEVLLIASEDATLGASGNPKDSRELLLDVGVLHAWISANYHRETTLGRFEVLRRRR